MDVAPLSLEFKSWPFGSLTGDVKHYGPPNYASAAEYTYFATGTDPSEGGTTYFNPVDRGFACASVPEPSSIMLGVVGSGGVLAFARYHRRKAKPRSSGGLG